MPCASQLAPKSESAHRDRRGCSCDRDSRCDQEEGDDTDDHDTGDDDTGDDDTERSDVEDDDAGNDDFEGDDAEDDDGRDENSVFKKKEDHEFTPGPLMHPDWLPLSPTSCLTLAPGSLHSEIRGGNRPPEPPGPHRLLVPATPSVRHPRPRPSKCRKQV